MPRSTESSAPSDRCSYAAGDLIADKYLLEQLLDEGGMGSVWVARNVDLDARVAVKLLRSSSVHFGAAERLKREARVEARLEHRAIVRVFDCGETSEGAPFIVMELLDGTCLAEILEKNGPLSPTEAVRVLLPIVDGLSAAHDKGIVHRDMKPANIFLARGARHVQPKIVDFGIASLGRWAPNPKLTLQGAVLGTPVYMAPEQARGLDDVDHRADVWAICGVLYEAVTSSPPFRGDSYNSVLRAIVEDPVTPLLEPSTRELWPILERGLSKDRELRFQSMRELGAALAQFLRARGVTEDVCGDSLDAVWTTWDGPRRAKRQAPARPARIERPNGFGLISFMAVTVAIGAVAAVAWRLTTPPPGPTVATNQDVGQTSPLPVPLDRPLAGLASAAEVVPALAMAHSLVPEVRPEPTIVVTIESLPHEVITPPRSGTVRSRAFKQAVSATALLPTEERERNAMGNEGLKRPYDEKP